MFNHVDNDPRKPAKKLYVRQYRRPSDAELPQNVVCVMRTRTDLWPDWQDNAISVLVVFTVLAIGILVGIAITLSLVN